MFANLWNRLLDYMNGLDDYQYCNLHAWGISRLRKYSAIYHKNSYGWIQFFIINNDECKKLFEHKICYVLENPKFFFTDSEYFIFEDFNAFKILDLVSGKVSVLYNYYYPEYHKFAGLNPQQTRLFLASHYKLIVIDFLGSFITHKVINLPNHPARISWMDNDQISIKYQKNIVMQSNDVSIYSFQKNNFVVYR